MKVRAIRSSSEDCPDHVRPFLPAKIPVTLGKEYDVHALATTFFGHSFPGGVTLLQIVDDFRYPSWKPAWLFEVIDTTVPSDWICNLLDDGIVILGPSFIAQDEASYASMVELEADQVERFWKRIERLSSKNEHL